ncbi:hypothetical protein SRIMM317S_02183 [Streptomyces rimosus subsp. rimosus]
MRANSSRLRRSPTTSSTWWAIEWSWAFNYLENVDGDAKTTNINSKERSAIPDKWKENVPAGADGVYDEGIPGTGGTRRPATRVRPCGCPRARRFSSS